jgi:hypothetical protein
MIRSTFHLERALALSLGRNACTSTSR